jgi:NAD(P)-dependent dehydrogenase (short-subunit alcohol dehydrogenase family)
MTPAIVCESMSPSATSPIVVSRRPGGARSGGVTRTRIRLGLVTGLASLRMAGVGWDAHAGVRREHDSAALVPEPRQSIVSVRLDVTDAADVAALAEKLPARLDALVNNAGIVVGGAVDELRRQLEVNVIGQLAVTPAVLPRLRDSRSRIMFVSSVSGAGRLTGARRPRRVFAIEAFPDALRLELRPWHIGVSLIEPDQIDTDL